jgi:lipoprotein-anchoring transpeptidase ErfK/SrfK
MAAKAVIILPDSQKKQIDKDKIMDNFYLLVDKQNYRMQLYNNRNLLKVYPIAIGKNSGDKQSVGDNRTPEGDFVIEKIEDSSWWEYDFGEGPVKAYGKWFIRLETKSDQTFSGKTWTGIGIHGTHDESSIGTNASRGCLRLHNIDLIELVEILRSLPDLHIPVKIRAALPENENSLS